MKYIYYILLAAGISASLFVPLALFLSWGYARSIVIITLPISLWSARLIVAMRRGIITRRIAKLDGGPTRAIDIWSFRPEIYERKPGFDNFKGYIFKEIMCCLLFWVMFISIPVMDILSNASIEY